MRRIRRVYSLIVYEYYNYVVLYRLHVDLIPGCIITSVLTSGIGVLHTKRYAHENS